MLKMVILVSIAVFSMSSTSVAATADGTSVSSVLTSPVDFSKNSSSEIGFAMSSLNHGTLFTSLAVNREFGPWFTGGLRAMVPAEFSRATQIYLFQAYGRFPILNDENVLYFEPQISQGMYSGTGDVEPFLLAGVAYGYTRRFAQNFTVGANIGVDFSTWRPSDEAAGSGANRSLYSRLGLTGGYFF